jgi:predicted site-specific integrase-resolvase
MRLIPDTKAAKKLGVCTKTLERWDEKPELNFPPIIWIGKRKFRDDDLLDKFIIERVKESAAMARRPTEPGTKRLKQLKQFRNQPATEAV